MFDELLKILGEFGLLMIKKIKFLEYLINNNSYEISFVNINFNNYNDYYLLLNRVVENKKLSSIIINNPIKSTIASVKNTTYYIR